MAAAPKATETPPVSRVRVVSSSPTVMAAIGVAIIGYYLGWSALEGPTRRLVGSILGAPLFTTYYGVWNTAEEASFGVQSVAFVLGALYELLVLVPPIGLWVWHRTR